MRKSTRVEKTCVICGKDFEVIASRANSAKTCGKVCRGKFIAKGYEDQRVQLNCKACGRLFSVPKCHVSRRVYCSTECADKHRGDHVGSGKDCHNWKGGRTIHGLGYVYLASPNHPFQSSHNYVFEHRLVVENELRVKHPGHHFLIKVGDIEYLRPEIEVHHIDEDKQNNSLDNLLACTAGAHRNIHDGKAPMVNHVWPEIEGLMPEESYKVKVDCGYCGNEFLAKRSDVERGGGIYCSRKCYDNRETKLFKIVKIKGLPTGSRKSHPLN